MRKTLLTVITGLLLMCGAVYADDSTSLDTEIMQFINSVPEKLDGQFLMDMSKSLRNYGYKDKYIMESFLCYQKGIDRKVSTVKPEMREKIRNSLLLTYHDSDIYKSSPAWAKEYILRYIITNATNEKPFFLKERAQKELNGMIECRNMRK
jgi:hypothetical protein